MGLIVGPGIYIGGASKNHISTEEYAGSQSPYTFIASKGRLKSLIRYGKCEQSGTPSTSSAVSIKCNNGTLTTKDAELPYGYRRLGSIEFEGNTYYNTNEKLYGADIVTMTISDFVSGGQNLFGAYAGSGDDINNFSLYIYGTSTGQAYWRYGQTLYRPTLGGTTQRTISFGAGGTDGFKTDVSYPTVEFESNSVAWIGGLPNSSSPKYDGKIVGNITVGTRLKYIPCVRSSDGAIGYYETVNGVFLEPQGSSPVAGEYDDAHLVPYVDGTTEVVTLSAVGVADQTVSVENLFAVGNVKDEQDIISGTVTRRCGVCVYDGTQSVGDTFISMTGEKTVGTIIVYLLNEPVVEQVTPQPLTTQEGYNTLTVSSSVTSPEYKITYPDDLTKGHFEAEAEYVFQKSGGSNAISDGTAKFLSMKGRSLVWNQLVQNGNFAGNTITNWATNKQYTFDGRTLEISGINGGLYFSQELKSISGHKYYISLRAGYFNIENPADTEISCFIFENPNSQQLVRISPDNNFHIKKGIVTANANYSRVGFSTYPTPAGSTLRIDCDYGINLIDLTLLFGPGNEPTTVEEFESLFPLPYYEYNAGEIISNKTEQVKVVGFNQWDEEWEEGSISTSNGIPFSFVNRIRSKNYIPAISNKTYSTNARYELVVFFYDSNYNVLQYIKNTEGEAPVVGVSADCYTSRPVFTTPPGTSYIKFAQAGGNLSTYNHDICINISDPARNGQYEPYKTNTIELNLPTLTGKLNGEGQSVVVFPDGLKSAGNVYDEIVGNRAIKRIGVVDMGTLTWTKSSTYPQRAYTNFSKHKIGLGNVVTSVYWTDNMVSITDKDKAISSNGASYEALYLWDSSFLEKTGSEVKASLSGVLLYYELAEPQVYILDTPLPKKYKVWSGGTEERLPRDTSSSVNAPVRYDVLYPEPEN